MKRKIENIINRHIPSIYMQYHNGTAVKSISEPICEEIGGLFADEVFERKKRTYTLIFAITMVNVAAWGFILFLLYPLAFFTLIASLLVSFVVIYYTLKKRFGEIDLDADFSEPVISQNNETTWQSDPGDEVESIKGK
jgi:hypothetical protein